jgi:hypothetical protein
MQGQDCFSRVSLEIAEATGKQELDFQLGGGASGGAEEADVFGGTSTLVTRRGRSAMSCEFPP